MSWAAIAGTLGTIAKGTVAVGKGALSLGSKGVGLGVKGVGMGVKGGGKVLGQLNPLTVADGAQKASMMNKFLVGARNLGTEEIKRQLPKFGETLGTDKSKLGALTKDLIYKAPEAAMAQEKRNQELISRYSTTPSLNRPAYSTNLQSILQDFRRS